MFDPFARFYDLDTEGLDTDLSFWIELARRTGGPVLEIGCGTGRVLLPLAKAGFTVVGVDVSPAMLAIAREKVKAHGLDRRIDLVECNALDLDLGRTFPLVFMALNSFGHFAEPGEPERALERMRAHLEPGGLLALDLTNPTPGAFGETTGLLIHEYTRSGPTPGWQTVKLRSQWQSFVAQRIDVNCIYDEVSASGEIRRTLAPFALRYFYPQELRLLFERAGLIVENIYGSYDLDPLDDDSDRLIPIGRNPGGVAPPADRRRRRA